MTGVLVGASVGGILGALLATPVTATGREVLHYIHRKLLDQEFPQIEEPAPPSRAPLFGDWLTSPLTELKRHIWFGSHNSPENKEDSSHLQTGSPRERLS
jgi:hypothetical protein